MKPIIIGAIVAALIVLAFLFGRGVIGVEEPGPAEKLGKALDDAASEVKKSAESTGN